MSSTDRKLKVYQSYNAKNQHIPEIRFKGKWLEENGFYIGLNIEIEIHDNMLIIKQKV
ncbi:hypothetical protein acsn021_06230 [Anaerocolumna cellulosilytica]|uniref:Uncharacterized protein n=1 Tax=Anaerocolumna cellulosilytica TaxID=433286 RepID=A0A6S6QR24_9FIRM|nr:SymE family type I addiction module toxin [Anaerocolumna cellulosilytica]MBB5198178.1 hypothetical protein [Anaerocolumna cellulosilytica]BCJ93054.1 hypothetical protein acsn021_06230 [Anaerocolumna cellulosilytica]